MRELPKVYDPKQVEKKIYQMWLEGNYFHAERDPAKKPFTIVIPPPNVTGQLHLGHAFDETIQDVLIRYKRMDGYSALWLPGYDHAGIATQIKVEEKLRGEGKTRFDLGREGFLDEVWAWKNKYGDRIVEQLKTLGSSCDWERQRFTMDDTCARAVRETFVDLYKKKLIYKGKRIINWCPKCTTALSDAEAREGAERVLLYVLTGILKLLHPFMPFITEEIFQAIPHEGEALIVAPYPKYDEALAFPEDEAGFERVMEVIRAVRSRRAEMNVPPSRKAKLIVCALDQDTYRAGAKYLTRLASASEVEVRGIAGAGSDEEESAEGMVTVTTPSARVLMPMAELVDLDAERARIEKELEKAHKQLEAQEKKLANESFVSRAPEAVVNAERERAEKAKALIANLEASLAKLK